MKKLLQFTLALFFTANLVHAQTCGAGFSFSGGQQRFEVTQLGSSTTNLDFIDPVNGFTWEAWVYLKSNFTKSDIGTILTAGDAVAFEDHYLYINANRNVRFTLRKNYASPGQNDVHCVTSSTLPLNTWTHIAGVCDSYGSVTDSLRIFINGVQAAATHIPLAFDRLSRANIPFTIGDFADNTGYGANADIDVVRVWKGARSASQIQAAMYNCLSMPQPNLIASFRGDDGAGTSSSSEINQIVLTANQSGLWGTAAPNVCCFPLSVEDNYKVKHYASTFPNPSSDIININLAGNFSSQLKISIYDMNGKVVAIEKNGTLLNEKNFSVNVNDFADGIYTFIVNDSDGNQTSGKFQVSK